MSVTFRGIVSVAGALGLLTSASACKKPDPAPPQVTSAQAAPSVKVQTFTVVEQPMPEYLTLTGTLRASQESEVAADASGKVTATYVERGQKVKQGDTMAILDARSAAISATAAAAQAQLAQAQLQQAQKECQRVKSLFQSGAISQAEYDRTTSQCSTSEWSAAAAAAQQKSAQKVVGDAVIRAPFTGIVGERFVNVGQYVMPSTKVATLYNADPLRLELTVPEANVGAVKPAAPVKFTVATFGDETFEGSIKFISPNVRTETRDLVIEALCPNPDNKLRPGMFAVANLAIAETKQAVVPVSSVVKSETAARVFVVVEGRIQERIVRTGGERDGLVGISAGVKPGENVVIKPEADVRDGAQVL